MATVRPGFTRIPARRSPARSHCRAPLLFSSKGMNADFTELTRTPVRRRAHAEILRERCAFPSPPVRDADRPAGDAGGGAAVGTGPPGCEAGASGVRGRGLRGARPGPPGCGSHARGRGSAGPVRGGLGGSCPRPGWEGSCPRPGREGPVTAGAGGLLSAAGARGSRHLAPVLRTPPPPPFRSGPSASVLCPRWPTSSMRARRRSVPPSRERAFGRPAGAREPTRYGTVIVRTRGVHLFF